MNPQIKNNGSNEQHTSNSEFAAPPIILEAFPNYILGSPMIVAITCQNPTPQSSFYNLPECDLLTAPGPVEIVFTSKDGYKIVLPATSPSLSEGPPKGFTLNPGDSRRMLFDISGLNPELIAGTYQLTSSYRLRTGSSASSPVEVKLITPSSADSIVADLMYSQNDLNEPSWSNFLEYNWRTIYVTKPPKEEQKQQEIWVDASSLSQEGKQALAFHLFIHYAVYGPIKLAEIDLEMIEAFASGPLAGEAAVIRLEILMARGDRLAEEEEVNILSKWPGLKWRVEEIKQGYGFLTSLRTTVGAEREFEKPPEFFPYTLQ